MALRFGSIHRKLTCLLVGVTVVLASAAIADSAGISPPDQPANGPGGKDYPHKNISVTTIGEGNSQCWIFEPAEPSPASAPVIVFCHGWGAMTPNVYGAWIHHLVLRGNIVIFPRYQESMKTLMNVYTPSAIASTRAALQLLQGNGHVKPDLTKVAIVGHSMGGAIAPSMAAQAEKSGLPRFSAVCSIEAEYHVVGHEQIAMPMANLAGIERGTLVQVITGEDDRLVGERTPIEIFNQMTSVDLHDKNYIIVQSDDHGEPALKATHGFPAAELVVVDDESKSAGPMRQRIRERLSERKQGIGVNALDFYGSWKLFDALTDAAFYGKNRNIALGNTPAQRFMGKWSDGTPVKELIVNEKTP